MKPLRLRLKAAARAVLIGAGSMLFYACLNPVGSGYGISGSGNRPATYFVDKVQPIFDQKCISCHTQGGAGWAGTGGVNGGLDLTAGKSYASLVNKVSFEKPDSLPKLRVQPSFTDSSYLYQKVTSSTPKFGGQMPLLAPALGVDEIDIIKTWIKNGAKP